MLLLLISIGFIWLGQFLKNTPINVVNQWLAYRTKKASATPENWRLAQMYAGSMLKHIFTILLLIGFVMSILDNLAWLGLISKVAWYLSIGGQLVAALIGIGLVYYRTEQKLM